MRLARSCPASAVRPFGEMLEAHGGRQQHVKDNEGDWPIAVELSERVGGVTESTLPVVLLLRAQRGGA